MVTGFHCSPTASDAPSPFHRPRASTKPNHVRSTSVPCCSHPALAHLQAQIHSALSLPPIFQTRSSVADCLTDGLDSINRLHAALGYILHLRPAATADAWADRLLDDTLRLADFYASLRIAADSLRHHAAEARTAIRRGDSVRLASAVRSHRHAEKELSRLAGAIKDVARPSELMSGDAAEVEFAGTIREAVAATASASVAIITGIAALSSSTTAAVASTAKESSAAWSLQRLGLTRSGRKREVAEESGAMAEMAAFEKLEGLEEILERLERGSECVYRSLVSTRVSLLNILTPSL